ncbi:MAG: hypothetical protein EOO25_01275 [Comamonadaceae bacterium]|nr:MAG: hypothetical protein EOO25_01275 [Comamonadaceae bacterium]
MLNGLGWIKSSPGSEVDASTRLQVSGNRSNAQVNSTGGKVGVAANLGGRVDLIATAQVNGAGLSAMASRNSQILVLQNQLNGLVNAIGGAATANSVLVAGGAGRKALADSRFILSNNVSGSIDAIGAKGSVLLGAGSLQLPGRAAANAVLLDESDVRRAQVASAGNRADRVSAYGGAALANALTAARSTLDDLRVDQMNNTARDVRAGGGSGGLGYGVVASADLTGAAAANTVAIAGSQVRGLRTLQSANQAENISALGGSALANSFSLTDYGAGLQQYQATLSGNIARDVAAHGGDAAILGGALADVSMAATALANAVSVQGGQLGAGTQHLLAGNRAEGVRATGGGAAANSVWLQSARSSGSPVTLSGNTAYRVETAGGAGNIGGGAVGAFERNSRALANSVVADNGAELDGAPLVVAVNSARELRASGGTVAAGSVLVSGSGSALRNVQVTLAGNRAANLRATGYEGSLGAGLLGSASQQAMLLANSLSAEGSVVAAGRVTLAGNEATVLTAQGGKLQANSISVEANGGGASRLGGDAVLAGNTARQVTTGASSLSGPGHAFSQERRARAAANAVALVEDAQTDGGSPVTIAGNTAQRVSAVGGTALVNALGAYRGARVTGSPVTIAGNTAFDVSAGGGSGQVLGAGSVRNGVLVANGVYLEAEGAARLAQTPVTVAGNTAAQLQANGGRLSANALGVNGRGELQASSLVIAGNRATGVRSEGNEGTVLGHAAINRGVGNAAANAALVLGTLRGAAVQLAGNLASGVVAEKGLAAANSLVAGEDGQAAGVQAALVANQSSNVQSSGDNSALAASLHNQGRLNGTGATLAGNTASARAGSGDALAASVRNRKQGSISGSQLAVAANRATARESGTAASIDNDGTVQGGQITVLNNTGEASNGGIANSVVNRGSLQGGQVAVLGNNGNAAGGTLNSVVNQGRISGSQVMIAGNSGSTRGGGTLNSLVNERSGSLQGANVLVAGNSGSVQGSGVVNSVVNKGVLSGRVAVVGNQGSATMGGTVNSLVNHGLMAGNVMIAGNTGRAMAGGTANSVINRGVITGSVAIVGSRSVAAAGITTGSVRNLGGAIVGSAAVTGNVPTLANPGYNYTLPSTGVINRSVTVGPASGLVNL